MDADHDHYDDGFDVGCVMCPKCMGQGSVNCHCGGDLCVCENYGERDCPVCHGEGEVTEERSDKWFERQREIHKAFHEAINTPSSDERTLPGDTQEVA